MNAPHTRATEPMANAPAPVRRPKGNPFRQHWLTGAFVCLLAGVVVATGLQVHWAGERLQEARANQARVEAELRAVRQRHIHLQETLDKVSSDEYMELAAKKMGFTRPNEKVYTTSGSTTN